VHKVLLNSSRVTLNEDIKYKDIQVCLRALNTLFAKKILIVPKSNIICFMGEVYMYYQLIILEEEHLHFINYYMHLNY